MSVDAETREKAMDLSKPLTPKSERPRRTYGSLSMSLQSLKGACAERKCVKRAGHAGDCWPA
jgi:hypothetical protein